MATDSSFAASLSIVVPVYNEEATLRIVVEKLLRVRHLYEVIIVDDCSIDGTNEIAQSLAGEYPAVIKVIRHAQNSGKTEALKTGFAVTTGNIVLVQDADLEYDSDEVAFIIDPIVSGLADVVYGSRFQIRRAARVLYFYHYLANQILTFISNLFTNLNLTDVETGYKAFKGDIIRNMILTSRGFGFEIEVTAKMAKLKCAIYEVPISYYGRTYDDGKKIGIPDGFAAIWYLLKYNLFTNLATSFVHYPLTEAESTLYRPSDSKAKFTDRENRHQQHMAARTPSVWFRFSQCLVVFLAICYMLQVASPLRMNTDAVVLLSMADSAAHGGNFVYNGQKAVFPPGYPLLLDILLRSGLAHPWVIISLNLFFLSVGLFASYSLLIHEFFEDKSVALFICSFFLLSYVVVKHFTIPLTDVPFFCCSMCCLFVMSQATKTDEDCRFVALAVSAYLLGVAALFMRRIGVALLPPLVYMLVGSPHFKVMLTSISRRVKVVIVAILAIVCIGIALVVAKTSTLVDFTSVVEEFRISALVIRILHYRLTELGMLMGNCPLFEMPVHLRELTEWIGSILFALVLFGLATRRRKISTSEVYLVSYMGILFMWPYRDARFWLPVIPLLIAYSVLAVERLRFPKIVATAYCIVFATLGFTAIAYSTRITFAGSAFPERYADGVLRSTYCAAFQTCRDGSGPNAINAEALRLLRDYH